ncbi:uncharacterized protein HMPREF1541_07794 [Cyphellophora europaea CBS 101466]|uniref:Class II aldolase/adducin N-terminal domain-containing protein n=1 Tax=Cyphellophora europaea (strain CBS 101466) TaxID=1220924 RepID=W2RPC0_CYPE1|nr:uncharacterized protein HMPREF1541_07794 [Cyphellophora europaea CBS 101466]ETN38170.1 hypothetical protein HMPREF1541_07794 [Cyphellophora europaea CBS 101466]
MASDSIMQTLGGADVPGSDCKESTAAYENHKLSALVGVRDLDSRTEKLAHRAYLKGRLVLAFRIFGDNRFDEGTAGHISLRDPMLPDHFWVNPCGLPFSMVRSSDLLLVSPEGAVIDGGHRTHRKHINTPVLLLHHAIHQARPEVMAAAHAHSLSGRAFCALGRNLDMITQDACAFHNDLALYTDFNGPVVTEDEAQAIVNTLGAKKAALLQNHGLLTVGRSLEEMVWWFISLEKCCYIQLLADAAAAGKGGQTAKIDEEVAARTSKLVGSSAAGLSSGLPYFEEMAARCGNVYMN